MCVCEREREYNSQYNIIMQSGEMLGERRRVVVVVGGGVGSGCVVIVLLDIRRHHP